MDGLPSGTVTFLLTDIEGSASRWEQDPDAMRAALAVHDDVVRGVIERSDGVVVKHMGDGCWAAFTSAPRAADAAIAILNELQRDATLSAQGLRTRVCLHTGEVEPTGDDYFGPAVNWIARLADLTSGNQIAMSGATAALLDSHRVRSDGLHVLRGIGEKEIFLLEADGIDLDNSPLRESVLVTSLPRVHTSFLGRASDVSTIISLFEADHSVVTLIGPGGVGKTRVAVETGHQLAREHKLPILFCDLSPITEDDDVVEAVAEAVGARRHGNTDLVDSIADHLEFSEAVVVLDNCEQVMDSCRSVVERLADVDGVSVLATSRQAFGLPGEQLHEVMPLDVSTAGVELFIDRARERDSRFELRDEDMAHVREIVEGLDGVPLAIELAAARVRALSTAEIARRLSDRFELLGRRGGGRHDALYEAVEWSYRMLTPPEAALFRRLAIFADGLSIPAAQAVCADDSTVPAHDVVDVLFSLVDKSMVCATTDGGPQRLTMLETIRAFAEDKLRESGETDLLRQRHAQYYCSLARHLDGKLHSQDEAEVWAELDSEWANLRRAFDTLEPADDPAPAAELVLDLVWYATYAMRFELFTWAGQLLERPGIDDSPAFVDLCGAAALGAYFTVGDDVSVHASRGLEADPSDPRGFCRTALAAMLLNNLHRPEDSDRLTAEWLDTNPGTLGSRMWAEGFRTFHLCTHNPSLEAARHVSTLRKMAVDTQSPTVEAIAAWAQGQAVALHDIDGALELWRAALEGSRSMPRAHLLEQLLVGIILHFAAQRDDLGVALEGCREAIRRALEHHYHVGVSHLFGVTAIVLCRAGQAEIGAKVVGAMIGNHHLPRQNATDMLRDCLGDEVDAYVEKGLGLTITDAAREALEALDRAIANLP